MPKEMKPRKKGRGAEVRQKEQAKKAKAHGLEGIPVIIMGNIQSLAIKLNELSACVKYQHEYCTCSTMCYTETWLTDASCDLHVNIEGFSLSRTDRIKDSGKKFGSGLCLFVNLKWCHQNNMAQKHKVCMPNVEMLTVSVRPYYIL